MSHCTKRLTVIVLGGLLALAADARASSFSWQWTSGAYEARGMFSTPLTSGLVTEANVTSHTYTVFMTGNPLFTIDLVAGTLTGSSGSVVNYHDFAYLIGSTHFQSANPSVSNAVYPVDFTVRDNSGFSGLSYETPRNGWFLNRFGPEVASTSGFSSGPVVSAVPEPATWHLLMAGIVGLCGKATRVRRRART